jgi:hypothetical protein
MRSFLGAVGFKLRNPVDARRATESVEECAFGAVTEVQTGSVGRDSEVRDVATHHGAQPPALFGNGLMASALHLGLEAGECARGR